MKRIITIILSLFYITLSTGAMVNLHYCGGELANIKVNSHTQSCCCGIDDFNNSCCKDKDLTFELEIDQNSHIVQNIEFQDAFLFSFVISGIRLLIDEDRGEEEILSYKLPSPKPEPLWLMNCTFTFYG